MELFLVVLSALGSVCSILGLALDVLAGATKKRSGPPVATRQPACETEDLVFEFIQDEDDDETAGS